jgi:hypothetical protein
MRYIYRFISVILNVVLLVCLLIVLPAGCTKLPQPVDSIQLFKAQDQPGIPTGGWLIGSNKDPMPGIVYRFSSSDKIFCGIRLDKALKESVTFTKYTFINKNTSVEVNVSQPEQLGPFQPGQIQLIAFDNPWAAPTQKGQYEFRIYLDNHIVAEALFDIAE